MMYITVWHAVLYVVGLLPPGAGGWAAGDFPRDWAIRKQHLSEVGKRGYIMLCYIMLCYIILYYIILIYYSHRLANGVG
jgi:hypothetical protein